MIARITNKIGVACVTAGPGSTNAIPGLAEAYVDSAPIIIISGQVERPQEKYQKAAQVVSSLQRASEMGKDGIDPEGDYEVHEKQRSCTLTDEGFAKAEQALKVSDLFDPSYSRINGSPQLMI